MSLALWLRAGRAQRGMSLEDVARVTKIQARMLERLEGGKLEGLPADVFVRGFVRSFAKCVGLDEDEALRRYGACASGAAISPAPAAARAMVEAMAELAPTVARTAAPTRPSMLIEAVAVEPALAAGSLQDLPKTATPVEPEPVAIEPVAVEAKVEPKAEPPVVAEPVAPAAPVVEAAAEAESAQPAKKKRTRRGGKGRNKRKQLATGTPVDASPVVDEEAAEAAPTATAVGTATMAAVGTATMAAVEPAAESVEPEAAAAEAAPAVAEPAPSAAAEVEPAASQEISSASADEPAASGTWRPKMPPAATQSVPPWRRPRHAATISAPAVPSLVIDDADPERAELELEEREAAKSVMTTAQRRSFLPPILLDREDRSARQGGLTLAVIILLIAATLTLSYLMRRPSSSGEGVTQADAPSQLIG